MMHVQVLVANVLASYTQQKQRNMGIPMRVLSRQLTNLSLIFSRLYATTS